MDLFAEALCEFYAGRPSTLFVERDDGFRDTEDLSWYLSRYSSFPRFEKQALKFAQGRVLDLGCGAGRHALYLQRRGLHVTAVDASARMVELAGARGVQDVRIADAFCRLPFQDGEFDTIILFGNNLGLTGTPSKFRRMLRELRRVTQVGGRLIGTTRMPSISNPRHCAYLRRNVELGRAVGQVRLRLELNGRRGKPFDLLLLSPTDLLQLAAKEGWSLNQVFAEDFEQGYAAVLEKGGAGK